MPFFVVLGVFVLAKKKGGCVAPQMLHKGGSSLVIAPSRGVEHFFPPHISHHGGIHASSQYLLTYCTKQGVWCDS